MGLTFQLADEPDDESREIGRLLFAGPVDFVKGVTAMPGLPPADRVEVCFAGRSNVGKSSLINALTGRKTLARASNTPGRTQEINYFALGEARYLVDLPGYGYAAVGHRQRDEFNAAVAEYLEHRENLRCVFVLLDARLPPQKIDLQFLAWIEECGVPHVLVLTKADKQSATRTRATIDQLAQSFAAGQRKLPQVFVTSSQAKAGRAELVGFIEQQLG